MNPLQSHSETSDNFKGLISHLAPALLSIFIFQVIAIEIYAANPLESSSINFSFWSGSQAIGGFLLGYISDKYCRKKTLIVTQIFGIVAVALMILFGNNRYWIILFMGLLFSPTSVARAALVDNFPKQSKVKIVGITFISLFIPWCFYSKIVSSDIYYILLTCLILLLLNLLFTIFLFEDRRDLSHQESHTGIVIKRNKHKAIFTALALLPGQTVFFLSDSFFEEASQNAPFFTTLGIGVLIGAIVSVFYKSIPHLSLLTASYGIGFIFSLLTVISIPIISISDVDLSMQVMLFSVLGGFYLPFVYDVILSAVSSSYRGATCGLIEGITSLSAFIGLATVLIFHPDEKTILILMTILFLTATIIQKRGEKAPTQK